MEQLKKRGGASGGDATITVLVIEDNRDMAFMIKSLLERRFGASVELAASCSDAREELRLHAFDIVTLDYQLRARSRAPSADRGGTRGRTRRLMS